MKGAPVKLETNGQTADVQINASLTAVELEDLMRQLALLRAQMTPAVPEHPADLLAPGMAQKLLMEDQSAMVIAQHAGGAFHLFCRHRGFGWLVYSCEAARAAGIAGYIASRIDGKTVDLFSDQVDIPHH